MQRAVRLPLAILVFAVILGPTPVRAASSELILSSITYDVNSLNGVYDDIVESVRVIAKMAGTAVDLGNLDKSVVLADLNYSTASQTHIADLNPKRYAEFYVTSQATVLDPDIPIDKSIGGWDKCACQEEWYAFCNATAAARAKISQPCMTCNRACEVLLGRRLSKSFDSAIMERSEALPVMQIWYFGRGNGTAQMDWGYIWLVLGNNISKSMSTQIYYTDIIPILGGNPHQDLVYPRNASDKTSVHWGDAQVDTSGNVYMSLGAPVWSQYGEFLGGFYAAIHTTTMDAYFTELSENTDSRVYMFLTISSGQVFSATNASRMAIFGTAESSNVKTLGSEFDSILSGTSAGNVLEIMKTYVTIKLKGVEYVVFSQRLNKINWFIFFFVEKEVVFPTTESHLTTILCAVLIPCFVGILAVSAVALVVYSRMRDRVHELESQLGSVATSNLIGTPAEEAIVVLLEVLKKKIITKADRKALVEVVSLIANNKLFRADSNLKDKVDKLHIGTNAGAFLINMLQSAPVQQEAGLIFGRSEDQLDSKTVSEASTVITVGDPDIDDIDLSPFVEPITSWDCDVETIKVTNSKGILEAVAMACLDHGQVLAKWDIPRNRLRAFMRTIEKGYLNNPYHNNIHAADVTQAMYFLLSNCTVVEFTPVEKLAAVYAAMVHDYRHGGLNNNFLRATLDPLYIRFNGTSVLESMHASESFSLMVGSSKYNFLEGKLKSEELYDFHTLVTQMILSTDMSMHIELSSQFTAKERAIVDGTAGGNIGKDYRVLLLKMMLKLADISNSSRRWPIYKKWIGRVISEFYSQGDRERLQKLPVSPFMDRYNTDIAKCQETFITFVVLPLATLLSRAVPAITSTIIPNLNDNKSKVHSITAGDIQISSSP